MNVSLVNPPQRKLKEPLAYIPLGLAYIGSSLLENGFNVKVENLADVDITDDIKFRHGCADVYIITYPSAAREGVKKTIDYIRKEYSKSKIILGGPHPSVAPYDVFNNVGGDVIITGEAEEFIIKYLKRFMNKDGIFHAGIINNLDSLSFPARKLFDYKDVVNNSGIHGCKKGVISTTMISSRGCNYQCSFCCRNHLMYSKWRYRSAENIKKELISLKEDYNIRHIRLVDDCFTLNYDRVKKICMYTKELEISFMCITRADICNFDTLKILKNGGCVIVDIGVESGSDRLLNIMNKGESTKQMKKCIMDAKSIGLKTKVFLQYNLPGETDEDIQKTIDFLEECKPDYYTLSQFVPLPGSKWENELDISRNKEDRWFYNDEDKKRKYLIDMIDSTLE